MKIKQLNDSLRPLPLELTSMSTLSLFLFSRSTRPEFGKLLSQQFLATKMDSMHEVEYLDLVYGIVKQLVVSKNVVFVQEMVIFPLVYLPYR